MDITQLVLAKLIGRITVPVAIGNMDATGRVFIPGGMTEVEVTLRLDPSTNTYEITVPFTKITADRPFIKSSYAVFIGDKWYEKPSLKFTRDVAYIASGTVMHFPITRIQGIHL